MNPRPVITCLLAIRLPDGDYVVKRGDPVSLEDAADWASWGWEVLPDPFQQEALTRFEQIERSLRWFGTTGE